MPLAPKQLACGALEGPQRSAFRRPRLSIKAARQLQNATGSPVEQLSDAVLADCKLALSSKSSKGTGLPVESARSLAVAVRHLRTSVWSASAPVPTPTPTPAPIPTPSTSPDTNPKRVTSADIESGLEPLQKLWGVLPTLFAALCGEGAPSSCRQLATEVSIQAGMWLVAVHFEATAARGPSAAAVSSPVSESALRFLSQHGRAGPADPEAWPLAQPLAAVLQALHHTIAAARYMPIPAVRIAVPVVVRCLTISAGSEQLASAAADLLQAILGQADEEMQGLALDQLSSAYLRSMGHTAGAAEPAEQEPSPLTAVVLRAVCAACVPGSTAAVQAKEHNLAMLHFKRAEDRTAALVDGILRQCLLGVRDREQNPGAWSWLDDFLCELLQVCANPDWVAAPLLLLMLTKGLARVASAPRSVDVAWTQREFAVKLLSRVAEVLMGERAALEESPAEELDLEELRRWTRATDQDGVAAQGHNMGAPESQLLSFLRLGAGRSGPCGAIFPPSCQVRSADAQDAGSPAATLTVAVLPAGHTAYSWSFLFCSFTAAVLGQPQERSTKEARRKASRQLSSEEHCRQPGSQPLLEMWTGTGTSICWSGWAKNRGEVIPCVTRLLGRVMHREAAGPLSRARLLALETLVLQIKRNPFAYVRRQAMSGLLAACDVDTQLSASQAVAEVIATGLCDESPCVRVACVDLIGRLLCSKSSNLSEAAAEECRGAVRLRLSDTSCSVRRAAFRVACTALDPADPRLEEKASHLLWRVRHESQAVREAVFAAVERVLLAPPYCKSVSGRLAAVAAQAGTSGEAIRDLLHAHQAALELGAFDSSVQAIVADVVGCTTKLLRTGDVMPWMLILEQVAKERSSAVHPHVWQLIEWLRAEDVPVANKGVLVLQACRILSDVLPSWAARTQAEDCGQVARHLQEALADIVQDQGLRQTRAAVECLCVLAEHVSSDFDLMLALYRASLASLTSAVESGAAINREQQQLLARFAWITAAALEHLDIDDLLASVEVASPSASGAGDESALAAARILSILALKGPMTLRPSLVPCIAFMLRRHTRFLCMGPDGLGSPLDVFRMALRSDPSSPVGVVMLGQCVESLAGLFQAYEAEAQAQARTLAAPDDKRGSTGQNGAPAICEAVQRLACLQPDLLQALQLVKEPAAAQHIISGLQSMSVLGVLHPSAALPCLLAAGISGFQAVNDMAKQLVLELHDASAQSFAARFVGPGIREAAGRLAANGAEHGSVMGEKWRFLTLCEIYIDRLETLAARKRFIDVIVEELQGIMCSTQKTPKGDTEVHSSGSAGETARTLLQVELLIGLLSFLPYRGELELARLVFQASRLMTLRVLPLVGEGAGDNNQVQGTTPLGLAAVAVLLQALCSNLAPGEGEIARLATVGSDAVDSDASEDQQLPLAFWRRPALNVAGQLAELAASAADDALRLRLLQQHVPEESPLLQGPGHGLRGSKRADGPGGATGQGKRKRGSTGDTAGKAAPTTGRAGKAKQQH